MKAVIFGAGNIGRGFIGQLFSQSGYELCFIDIAGAVIDSINREGRYPVRILDGDGAQDIWIEGVSAVNGRNEEDAAQAIADADIVATAVGVRALPLIAPALAGGIKKRFALNKKPLNIIICENLIDADKFLRELIKNHLTGDEQTGFDGTFGLIEASIGRMVPLQTAEMQDGNPLRVCVEAYCYLPVDKAAFKGKIPVIEGMYPFDNFYFYIQRKLFIHNMGHGLCAYLGMMRGDTFIYEAAGNGGILYIAQNAMLESALALSEKYQMPLADLHRHIRDLLFRFTNKALGDTCERVGSDTLRKLGNKDRFIGALKCCKEEAVNSAFISAGTAAGLFCHLKEKNVPQNIETARKALAEVSGLERNSEESEKILLFYSLLIGASNTASQDGDFDITIKKIIKAASGMGQRLEV